MYRVPSSPRYRLIRILKIGMMGLCALPALALNIFMLCGLLIGESEQTLREIRRADLMTLLLLSLALIGIGTSGMLMYAAIKGWPRRKRIVLIAISMATVLFDWWYLYAVDVMA